MYSLRPAQNISSVSWLQSLTHRLKHWLNVKIVELLTPRVGWGPRSWPGQKSPFCWENQDSGRVLYPGILDQIQARWQTLSPGPRSPRTTNPIPALRGALGPKGAEDQEPERSGAAEPHPAASTRRTHPGLCSPPPAPGPPGRRLTYASPPFVVVVEGGRNATYTSRGPHRRGASASAAPRALPECWYPGPGPLPMPMLGVGRGCPVPAAMLSVAFRSALGARPSFTWQRRHAQSV